MNSSPASDSGTSSSPRWAIALHGGAGTLLPDATPEKLEPYHRSLQEALARGQEMLASGSPALDVVETVVRILEDNPLFNAGKGAVYTEIGTHELDASIMDGRTLACGAVAGVRTIKNPITLARAVMEKSSHVLLISDGAETFADTLPIERVPNSYFDTPERFESLQKKLRERAAPHAHATPRAAADILAEKRSRYGTVGCVALDTAGNLAAATSTGGLTAKRFGRVGDAPIIGAGTYADNRSAAISCTGTGEEFIRHGVARSVAALVEYKQWSVAKAAEFIVNERLEPEDGGLIAVSRTGEIAMRHNCAGMYRAMADSTGRRDVRIFE